MEITGGTLIILGIYARQVALLLLPILVVAGWTHLPNGWVFTNAGGGYEYPLFLIASSFVVALLGEGALALRPAKLFPQKSPLPAS
jgi:putative oxidoreductase